MLILFPAEDIDLITVLEAVLMRRQRAFSEITVFVWIIVMKVEFSTIYVKMPCNGLCSLILKDVAA